MARGAETPHIAAPPAIAWLAAQRRRTSRTRRFAHLAQSPAEEVVEDAIAIFRVGHDDALKAAVALILLDRLFEETAHEGRAGDIRRIVPQHRRHFLIERFALHLFEADEILFRELCPVPVVEGTDNLGKRLRLVIGIAG